MAMMMVIGFMLVAGVIVATALSYATSLQPRAVNGQDRVEALSAAQAGIDHYLGHLNQDRNYFATPDCDEPSPGGPQPRSGVAHRRLRVGRGHPGRLGQGPARRPERPRSSTTTSTPGRWTSSRSGCPRPGVPATSSARSRPRSPSRDPSATCTSPTSRMPTRRTPSSTPPGPPTTTAARAGPPRPSTGGSRSSNERTKSGAPDCVEIQFIAADVLDGPVHFNDTPLINGNATFKQGFTTYATGCPKTATTSASAAKTAGCFRGIGQPLAERQGCPVGQREPAAGHNRRHRQQARVPVHRRHADPVQRRTARWMSGTRCRPGPRSASSGSPAVVAAAPNCGTPANYKPATGQKYPAAKQTVNVPDGMVIYVRNSADQRHLRARPDRQRNRVGQRRQGRHPDVPHPVWSPTSGSCTPSTQRRARVPDGRPPRP